MGSSQQINGLSVSEGIVFGIVIALVFKKQGYSIDEGWYWVAGVLAGLLFCVLFRSLVFFRIAAFFFVTPFVAYYAYAVGKGMGSYPVGLLCATGVVVLSVLLHIRSILD